MNAKQLTLAREFRGKTQSQLASEIKGLTQGNLSRIEKSILGVTDDMLKKISDNLNFPISFFKKEHIKTPISEFYYRKRVNIPKKHLSILEAKIDIYRMIIDSLLESIEIPEFRLTQFNLEDGGTPEQVARKIRHELNIPKGPIKNLISTLEKNGIIVVEIDSPTEKFDGITTITDKNQPVIFLNKNIPNDRKRFSIAHELGHLIMHIPFTLSNERDEEQETNTFAAEFSMPELDAFNQLVNMKFQDLSTLKRYWQMSMQFIIMRAKRIGAISESKAKYFMIELSRRGWRKNEPINVYIDKPKILDLLIKTHVNELEYTENELSKVLSLSIFDFNNLLEKDNIIHLRT